MTLRLRLTLAFLLVLLVPLVVGGLVITRTLPSSVGKEQARGVQEQALSAAQVLRGLCDQAQATAEAAGRASVEPGLQETLSSLVRRGLADGVTVTGSPAVTAGTVPASPHDCSTPATGGSTLDAVLTLTRVGRAPATAVASYDLVHTVLPLLAGGGASVALVDADGREVARDGSVPVVTGTRAVRHDGRYVASAPGGTYRVVVAEPVRGAPDLLLDVLLVALLALVLALGIAVVTARATTRPLQELTDGADRVAQGDLEATIPVRSSDEVGQLARSFNVMTAELRTQLHRLEVSRDELQAGLARLGDTLTSTHDLDRILSVVVESAAAATGAQSGVVVLLTPEGDALVPAATFELEVPADLRVPLGEGLLGQAAETGVSMRGRVGSAPGEVRPVPGEPDGTSAVAVPITSGPHVLGVVALYGAVDPDGFRSRHLATLRTLASQAGVAIDNVLLHEEAQRLSLTDALTGLGNYRSFTLTVAREIERATRFGRPMSLLLLDLDHFKNVNDTHGHPRGDAVLVELAERLRTVVRDVDSVCRYGGEEIVLVLPETDLAGAERLAARVVDVVRATPFAGTPPLTITVSVGGAVFPQDGRVPSALLARADAALYTAKSAGRDTWRLHARTGATP